MSIVNSIKAQMAPASKSGGTRRDAVVEVMGYDLDNETVHVKEGDREFNVTISQFAYKPDESKMEEVPKFMGSTIDVRMQKNIPVGDKVILEGMDDYGNDLDGKPQPVQWISSSPVDEAKLQRGVITLKGYSKRVEAEGKQSIEHNVGTVHLWSEKSFGADNLDAIAERLDASVKYQADAQEAKANGAALPPVKPTLGFALRTLVNGEVVNYTPVVDYNTETKLPPSGADLKEAFAAWKDQAATDFGAGAAVEVAVCRAYRASSNFVMKNPGPGSMIGTKASYDASGETPQYGNSVLAGHGLIRLSTGKYNQKGHLEGAESDWANTVYCSSKKAHLHTLIKDSEGHEVKLTEGIVMTYPNSAKSAAPQKAQSNEAQTEGAQQAAQSQPAQAQAPEEKDELDAALEMAQRNLSQGAPQAQ